MVKLVNIRKKNENKVLFNNLNFSFKKGCFYVITGTSGSGKSSLLNIIGGLDFDYDGKILVKDKKISNNKRKKYFDFLFQNYGLIDSETVKYNLSLVKKKKNNIYEKILEAVKLDCKLDQYVYTLSGGEQQRLSLARLLLSDRECILADEPTASLDIGNRDYIIDMLINLNEYGKTIILVTHDEALINKFTELYKVIFIENMNLIELQ